MNKQPDSLERLFRSASLAWNAEVESPSFELETRVMTSWNRFSLDEEVADLSILFRRGVVLAFGLAVIAVAASLAQMAPSPAEEWEFSGMMVQFVALK